MPDSRQNEFSRPVVLTQIGTKEVVTTLAAEPQEREAVARRLELVGLDRLEGKVSLRRVRGGAVLRLAGSLSAAVRQACVVTLQPVAAELQEEFTQDLVPLDPGAGSPEFDPEAETDVEAWPENDVLDLGELLVQVLAERLDPYPRLPGVALEAAAWGPEADEAEERIAPFADLKDKLQRQ